MSPFCGVTRKRHSSTMSDTQYPVMSMGAAACGVGGGAAGPSPRPPCPRCWATRPTKPMPITTIADAMTARISTLGGLLIGEALVDRLGEHVRRPRRVGPEATVPILTRLGRFDLRQRHSLL